MPHGRSHLRHTFGDLPIGATFWFTKRETTRGATFHGVPTGRAYVKIADRRYRDVDDVAGRLLYETRRDALVSGMPPESSMKNRAGGRAKSYEIYYVDSGRTTVMTESQARKHFGKDEWKEYKAGYLPHVVVSEVFDDSGDRADGNRARGSSPRKNTLSTPTRVATLASLFPWHDFDPALFYYVKGGKLMTKEPLGGRGYGGGKLVRGKTLGAIPGFKKTLFYSVKNGVVFARKRK